MVRLRRTAEGGPRIGAAAVRSRAAAPSDPVLALQRSVGNAAVQRWLRPSAPRLMRIEIECADATGKSIKLETDEKSVSDLAALALHKKNAGNIALQDALFKRTLACTTDDILALLRSFNLAKLLHAA